jgi:hypothetical protein
MNLILEKTTQVPYFTNMQLVLSALGATASDFDWYISDIETNYYGENFTSEDRWMDGLELHEFITNNEVQFIWAVFSAVPKGSRPVIRKSPYVEGNPTFWDQSVVKPQLDGALFEIACWDSSATILVGIEMEAGKRFKRAYPDTKLLSQARA